MQEIRFPIVIISSPRTGSTVLAYELKNKYNIKLFNEPFTESGGIAGPKFDEQEQLLSLIKNNQNNFILKIHYHQLYKYPKEIHNIIKEHKCHLIRIRRRDIVKQCVSYYIELQRNIWGYYKGFINESELINTSVPINQHDIKDSVKRIKKVNDELNNLSYVFDQDVWYEDLNFNDETFILTPKPNNYDIIKQKIETILK